MSDLSLETAQFLIILKLAPGASLQLSLDNKWFVEAPGIYFCKVKEVFPSAATEYRDTPREAIQAYAKRLTNPEDDEMVLRWSTANGYQPHRWLPGLYDFESYNNIQAERIL